MGLERADVDVVDAITHWHLWKECPCSGAALVVHHGLIHRKHRSCLTCAFFWCRVLQPTKQTGGYGSRALGQYADMPPAWGRPLAGSGARAQPSYDQA
jgi:hypothetical protein